MQTDPTTTRLSREELERRVRDKDFETDLEWLLAQDALAYMTTLIEAEEKVDMVCASLMYTPDMRDTQIAVLSELLGIIRAALPETERTKYA